MKLIEVTRKVLQVVGYENVTLSSLRQTHSLRLWLPYIRETKPHLDLQMFYDKMPYKMYNDLYQSIEYVLISLVLAFPSSDQAKILGEWLKTKQERCLDLSVAFGVWCYKYKVEKRILSLGLIGVNTNNTSTSTNVGH